MDLVALTALGLCVYAGIEGSDAFYWFATMGLMLVLVSRLV